MIVNGDCEKIWGQERWIDRSIDAKKGSKNGHNGRKGEKQIDLWMRNKKRHREELKQKDVL